MSRATGGRVERFSERNAVVIQVDHDICAGFGDCVEAAGDVFGLDEAGLAVVLDPDAVETDVLIAAAEACPVSAILLFDASGVRIAPDS